MVYFPLPLLFIHILCDATCDSTCCVSAASQKPGMDVADGYVTFVRHSQDMLRDKVNEEVYIERLFDVSKMPSPPNTKGGAFQNVAKQTGQRGISPILKPGNVFEPGEEAVSVLPLFSRSLSLSVSSLNFSCCPLHSVVHCHSAFGPLCIRKVITFIYKESIKASTERIITSSAFWKEQNNCP